MLNFNFGEVDSEKRRKARLVLVTSKNYLKLFNVLNLNMGTRTYISA